MLTNVSSNNQEVKAQLCQLLVCNMNKIENSKLEDFLMFSST